MQRPIYTLVATILVAFPALADTQSLEISDCKGEHTVRYDVEAGTPSSVRVTTLDNAATDATLSKLNEENSPIRSLTAPVRLSTVIFDGVTAGNWRVCFGEQGVSVDSIAMVEETSGTVTTAAVGITGALGGALVLTSGGSDRSAQSSAPHVTQAASTSSGNGVSSGLGGSKGVGANSSSPCFIGDDVVPMSPFS